MKVKELIAALAECNQENEVVIPVEKGYPTIGGTPRVSVEVIQRGFDWDHGQILLRPGDGKRLTEMSKEEYTSLIHYKQLVMGMRGKEELAGLSDIFVRKEFVISLLRGLADVDFDTEVISKIKEEKL